MIGTVRRYLKTHLVPVHPFLIGMYPIMAIYAANARIIQFSQTLRGFAISLGMVSLFIGLAFLISRSWKRSALAVTAIFLPLFSYGHIYAYVNIRAGNRVVLPANVLAAACAVEMIVLPWFFFRVAKPGLVRGLTLTLNSIGITALLLCSVTIIQTGIIPSLVEAKNGMSFNAKDSAQVVLPVTGTNFSKQEDLPDIYYIVVDTYTSDAVLEKLYGIQQNPLTGYLKEKGFTVIQNAHSNYPRTSYSLATSLNYDYIDKILTVDPEVTTEAPVAGPVKQNKVFNYLKEKGYTTVAFSTGYGFTEIKSADVYLNLHKKYNGLEYYVLRGSVAVIWMDLVNDSTERDMLQAKLKQLEGLASMKGPKFVFLHYIGLHPPFVFDKNGGAIKSYGMGDGELYEGTQESYLKGYAGQVLYINQLLETTIDTLLRDTASPPVIIIQGDHGSAAYYSFYDKEDTCLFERFSILNAYYLPDEPKVVVPEDITPVNSFRLVFNAYFDENLPMLENRTYNFSIPHPFQFEDVTGRLDECTYTPQYGQP